MYTYVKNMISDTEHVFFTAERKPPLNLYRYIYIYISYICVLCVCVYDIIYIYVYINIRVLNVADKKKSAEISNKICFISRMIFCLQ